MASPKVLPRPVGFADKAVEAWANRLTTSLQQMLDQLYEPARAGIQTQNVTPVTSLDPTTATLPQVANALGTLIAALKQPGRIT
jgi:predicted trehalose synthase